MPREQVSLDQFHLGMWITARDVFDSFKVPRYASKTNQITKTAIKQILDYPRANEARSPGHKNRIIWGNDEGIVHKCFQANCDNFLSVIASEYFYKNCDNQSSQNKVDLGCYSRFLMDPQPFFKYDEAKKHFMIVLSSRRMLGE